MNFLFKALIKKLEGDVEVAKANALVYQNNAAGIGEHPDIIEALETQVTKITDAEDKIYTINKHFSEL